MRGIDHFPQGRRAEAILNELSLGEGQWLGMGQVNVGVGGGEHAKMLEGDLNSQRNLPHFALVNLR
ncbi:MAG: hypothetical protein ACREP9_20405 [Candidatus Dormibacteraceae bacterium]